MPAGEPTARERCNSTSKLPRAARPEIHRRQSPRLHPTLQPSSVRPQIRRTWASTRVGRTRLRGPEWRRRAMKPRRPKTRPWPLRPRSPSTARVATGRRHVVVDDDRLLYGQVGPAVSEREWPRTEPRLASDNTARGCDGAPGESSEGLGRLGRSTSREPISERAYHRDRSRRSVSGGTRPRSHVKQGDRAARACPIQESRCTTTKAHERDGT